MVECDIKSQSVWKCIRLIGSFLLLFFLLSGIGYTDVFEILSRATLWPILLCILIILGGRGLIAYRWHLLVRTSTTDVGFLRLLHVVMVSGFLGFLMPGAVGVEVVRVHALARRTDLTLALSSVVVERLTGLLALIGFVLVGLLFAPINLPGMIGVAVVVVIAVLSVTAISLFVHPVRTFYFALLAGRMLTPLRERLIKFYRQIDSFRNATWLLPQLAALSIALQLLRVLEVIALAVALDVQADLAYMFVIAPLGIFAMLLPISFGGLGVREALYVALFGAIGVDAAPAFTLSFLNFVLSTMFIVVPGGILYAFGGLIAEEEGSR